MLNKLNIKKYIKRAVKHNFELCGEIITRIQKKQFVTSSLLSEELWEPT